MKRKNASLLMATSILALLTACSSNKQTSDKTSRAESTQSREARCLYTKQQNYITQWEKNQSQQNLIESLQKRITMLEERMSQKDGAAAPIPNMVVEPSRTADAIKPYEKCMKNRPLKSVAVLAQENKKQESEIRTLHKKATDLTLELQSKR